MNAVRLAEKVAEAWYGSGHPGNDAEALGVVAGLCLLVWPSTMGPDADKAAAMLTAASDDEIADALGQAWAGFWLARPDLAFRCGPFGDWLDQEPRDPHRVKAAGQVARAAIKAGLWSGRFADEDILGTVYTNGLRSTSARQARGEFYTPPNVTYMMAAMNLAAQPGQSICDPCCGTGGMFLGAARALRDQGQDPAGFWWFGCDISPVSVAAACVNAHLWELGPRTVFGCADTLAEGDWHVRARREQLDAIEQHQSMVRAARMLAILRDPETALAPRPAAEAPEQAPEPAGEAAHNTRAWYQPSAPAAPAATASQPAAAASERRPGRRIPEPVLDVLRASTADGDKLHLPPGQLERSLYADVAKTLKAAGFRWHSKRSGGWHELAEGGDAAAVLACLLGDGTVRTQQDTQFFPTPPAVVDRLLDLAELEPDMIALEPSAGQGAIAGPLAARVRAVDCIELDPRNVAKLEAAGFARVVMQADFLAVCPPLPDYPAIVMNPPFTGQQDIKHIRHALRFLRPGGRLVSVMAAGVDFRTNKTTVDFRELVKASGGRFIELPPESFRESGTLINTRIVVIPGVRRPPEPAPADDDRSRRLAAGTGMSHERVASFLADVNRLAAEAGDQMALF